VIAALLATVLSLLAGLHLYWALGGRWGWDVVLPERDGRPAFTPSRLACVAVALGLAAAGCVALVAGGLRTGPLPGPLSGLLSEGLVRPATGVVAVVFLLRAVGDFRLVGFFKRQRGSSFARWDSRLFSPLCLLLALGFAHLAAG
jgi:hypothetical protein